MKPTETLNVELYYVYLDFIEQCKLKQYNSDLVLHKHHIIPKFINNSNPYINNTVKLSVDDHIEAHILLSRCFDENSYEQIGNLRSAKLLSKNSCKYADEFEKIYENQKGDNNPAKRPNVRKKIVNGLKKYYLENKNPKSGKTYEDIYGENAEVEKQKRKKNTRTKESYKISGQKVSLKNQGKNKGGDNPFAKKIEVNGIQYNSVVECLTELKISTYKLYKYYNVKEIK